MLSIQNNEALNNKYINLLDMPDELLINIIKYLPTNSLLITSSTCKKLNIICLDQSLWKNIYKKIFGNSYNVEPSQFAYTLDKKINYLACFKEELSIIVSKNKKIISLIEDEIATIGKNEFSSELLLAAFQRTPCDLDERRVFTFFESVIDKNTLHFCIYDRLLLAWNMTHPIGFGPLDSLEEHTVGDDDHRAYLLIGNTQAVLQPTQDTLATIKVGTCIIDNGSSSEEDI